MKKSLLFLLLFFAFQGFSQRFNVLAGNYKNLKGISQYNVTFDYTNLKVHGFETEADYINEKKLKRKDKEGKAEEFEKDWYEARKKQYEPAFIAYFNKKFEKGEVVCSKNSELQYTMNVKTTWIYPGYFSEPAKISAVITFTETKNPSNVLFSLEYEKSIGYEDGDFNGRLNNRISGAYEKLAKNITLQLKRLL